MNAFNFAIIVLLLGFAGFLAGTEASLNSISRIAVEELVNSKKRGSAWLLKVTSNRVKYLNVVLLVPKACELAATAIVATIALDSFTTPSGAIRVASPKTNEEYAQVLYEAFRLADNKGLRRVFVIPPTGDGIAVAINDRLAKSAFEK